jgi:hypothetical protein
MYTLALFAGETYPSMFAAAAHSQACPDAWSAGVTGMGVSASLSAADASFWLAGQRRRRDAHCHRSNRGRQLGFAAVAEAMTKASRASC